MAESIQGLLSRSRTQVRDRAREKWHDPVFWTEVLQVVKTVVACVVAWMLATRWLGLAASFLAPWSALLVVHATVYRTFADGARQVSASVLGVVLAWGIGHTLGLNGISLAVALLVGLGVGALPWFAGQFTAVAATALFVITAGTADEMGMLVSRIADTGIGIATGLLVNLLVWPPLRTSTAISALNKLDNHIGELLVEIGEGLAKGCGSELVESWLERTRELDEELDSAWAYVRQARESAALNPRRQARELRDPQHWHDLLSRIEQAVAETRSMADTLVHGLDDGGEWESDFREPYLALLRDAGRAIALDEQRALRAARERLDGLVDLVGTEVPTPRLWPVYGALIINMRNIIDAMDEVAAANPLVEPPPPFARVRARIQTPNQL